MLNRENGEKIKETLFELLDYFEHGTTIFQVSERLGIHHQTIRSRQGILKRIGVCFDSHSSSEAKNIKVFFLSETLESAKEKVRSHYEPKISKGTTKKKADRSGSGKSGRRKGWGIESWFFMNDDRAGEYLEWCDPWTVEGQKLKKRRRKDA